MGVKTSFSQANANGGDIGIDDLSQQQLSANRYHLDDHQILSSKAAQVIRSSDWKAVISVTKTYRITVSQPLLLVLDHCHQWARPDCVSQRVPSRGGHSAVVLDLGTSQVNGVC